MLVISPDQFLMVDGKYVWSPQRVRWAWAEAMRALKGSLATGQYKKLVLLMGPPGAGKSTWLSLNQEEGVVYFDACFPDRRTRKPVVQEGAVAGVPVEVVWLQTPVEVCIAQNNTRTEDRKIPEDVIRSMWARLQASPPAPLEEGYTLRLA